MPDHTNGKTDNGTKQCYELRLVKIAGGEESIVESREIPRDKLEAQASQLPNREAMSLVNANIAIPVNAAVAANVLSDGAIAYADAAQQTPIDQGN